MVRGQGVRRAQGEARGLHSGGRVICGPLEGWERSGEESKGKERETDITIKEWNGGEGHG